MVGPWNLPIWIPHNLQPDAHPVQTVALAVKIRTRRPVIRAAAPVFIPEPVAQQFRFCALLSPVTKERSQSMRIQERVAHTLAQNLYLFKVVRRSCNRCTTSFEAVCDRVLDATCQDRMVAVLRNQYLYQVGQRASRRCRCRYIDRVATEWIPAKASHKPE